VEEGLAKARRLEELEGFVLRHYGQPAAMVLAEQAQKRDQSFSLPLRSLAFNTLS
jgi:hypothetical protein